MSRRHVIFEGSLAEKLRFWASTLYFWRKSRRNASFWSFKGSFLKEVSQKSFVFELQSFNFEGSLAEKLRFWSSKLRFWRKSRRKASFLSFKASILKEVSRKSFVWQNRLNHTSVDNQITWTSNHLTSKSLESQINWQPTHLNLKSVDNQITWISDQLTTESLEVQINRQPNHLTLNSFESDINWLSNQLNSAHPLPIGPLSLETSVTASCGRYVSIWLNMETNNMNRNPTFFFAVFNGNMLDLDEAFVFLDDNPMEVESVRQQLPEVGDGAQTDEFSPPKLSQFLDIELLSGWWFLFVWPHLVSMCLKLHDTTWLLYCTKLERVVCHVFISAVAGWVPAWKISQESRNKWEILWWTCWLLGFQIFDASGFRVGFQITTPGDDPMDSKPAWWLQGLDSETLGTGSLETGRRDATASSLVVKHHITSYNWLVVVNRTCIFHPSGMI